MDGLPSAIGRYEIKAFIARGGMGTLYLASDPVLQRQVAIKLLREADNDELRARFTREARAAANLRHRNIVTIFDVGDHDGQPFMAMEYIHGQTLGSLIATDPPPSTVRRLEFIEDLCDGLAYAHKRGVVHRDIKPANLMVDADGTLKILDFGIARAAAEAGMTQAGLLVGTLNYMSPEQVAGTAVDGRSDMFAVGAVMYELLTRRQAFPGSIDGGVLNKILNTEPEPFETLCPHLDPAIGQIIRRAIHKDPGSRFGDLQQMRADVAVARRALEASTLSDVGDTVAILPAQQTSRATPTPSRRGPDREDIARRRAQQIDEHLAAARQALADGAHDEAIARCEQVLLIDPNEGRALDIAERARLQREEQAAREWLERAQQHLRSGELTTASNCVREAMALTPGAPEAVEMARLVGEARLTQERERQRAAAVESALARGREAMDRGAPESAIVASDEALAILPAHEEARQLKERAQQAMADRDRRRRDEDAQQVAAEARELFDKGQHAEALGLLEQFWPAHQMVSQLWTELSAEAARLENERAAQATVLAAPPAAAPGPDATVFAPRSTGVAEPPLAKPPAQGPPGAAVERTVVGPASAPPRQTRPIGSAHPISRTAPSRSRTPLYAIGALAAVALVALLVWTLRGPAPAIESTDIAAVDLSTDALPPPLPVDTDRIDSAQPEPQPDGEVPRAAPDRPPSADTTRLDSAPPPDAPREPRRPEASPSTTKPLSPSDGTRLPPVRDGDTEPATPPEVQRPPAALPSAPLPGSALPAPPVIPTAPSAGGTGRSAEPAGATTAPPAPDTARDANAGAAREPAREPPAPQPSERELIERTLAAYAAAYRRLDTDAVRRIHPTIDGARLRDNFEQTREQTVEIVINEVSVTGNTATVSGLVRTRAEPKVGRPLESNVRTEFRLQKRGSTWVIVERRGA